MKIILTQGHVNHHGKCCWIFY